LRHLRASTRYWSPTLLANPEALAAAERINIALRRVVNILDEHGVCGIRTLEAKISEAGPGGQRVDPHLLSIALHDLVARRRVLTLTHASTGNQAWYAYPRQRQHLPPRSTKLDTLASLHAETARAHEDIGNALEAAICTALENTGAAFRGRVREISATRSFSKDAPPQELLGRRTSRLPDFIFYDNKVGPIKHRLLIKLKQVAKLLQEGGGCGWHRPA
jgi:hypothetical protein